MRNLVSEYVSQFRQDRQKQIRLGVILAALAVLVAGVVFWQLHNTGVAMTNEVFCGQEEHVHDDVCYEEFLVCDSEDEDHVHDDSCYETVLTCELPEHTHTVECLIDETADVETAGDWEATLPKELSGIWPDDVVAIAESQVGYTESEQNFQLAKDGETHQGYTRYGAWYGNEYGDWDAMFVSFCLNYAGVPEDVIPENSGAWALSVAVDEEGLYIEDAGFTPEAGDLVFFDKNGDGQADRVGIISDAASENELSVIEGDSSDAVEKNVYETGEETIIGYGVLPDQDPAGESESREDSDIYEIETYDNTEEGGYPLDIYEYTTVDGEKNPLAGAVFVLQNENDQVACFELSCDNYYTFTNWAESGSEYPDAAKIETINSGYAHLLEMPLGTYTLTEIKAPNGYKPSEPTEVTIDGQGEIEKNGGFLSFLSDENIKTYPIVPQPEENYFYWGVNWIYQGYGKEKNQPWEVVDLTSDMAVLNYTATFADGYVGTGELPFPLTSSVYNEEYNSDENTMTYVYAQWGITYEELDEEIYEHESIENIVLTEKPVPGWWNDFYYNGPARQYIQEPIGEWVYVTNYWDPALVEIENQPVYPFDIYKYTGDDTPLEGAAFELTNAAGSVAYFTYEEETYTFAGWLAEEEGCPEGYTTTIVSENDGYAHVAGMDEGTYTLTETGAPAGYELKSNPIEVEITGDTDNKGGDILKIRVENTPSGSTYPFDLYKYTNVNGEKTPLSGAKFELTDTAGRVAYFELSYDNYYTFVGWLEAGNECPEGYTTTIETIDSGYAHILNMPLGTYTLTETSAPDGYILSEPTEITIDGKGEIEKNGGVLSDLPNGNIEKYDVIVPTPEIDYYFIWDNWVYQGYESETHQPWEVYVPERAWLNYKTTFADGSTEEGEISCRLLTSLQGERNTYDPDNNTMTLGDIIYGLSFGTGTKENLVLTVIPEPGWWTDFYFDGDPTGLAEPVNDSEGNPRESVTATFYWDPALVEIEDQPETVLPSTGGVGTWIYTATGLLLVGGAGALLVSRKRRAVRS